MKKTVLRKYAQLIAASGVNVQPGQEVFIAADLDQPEFVKLLVEEDVYKRQTQPFEDLTGIMPGTTVTKIAEVRNTGEADAWIRVRLTGDIRLTGDGTPDPSLVKPCLLYTSRCV